MGGESYGSRGMDDTVPPDGAAGASGDGREGPETAKLGGLAGRRAGHRLEARAAAIGRRRDVVVAAERLGELRGLAVADAVGDLPHGQPARAEHLGGAAHPDGGQVVAERRVADLGVGALQLAARRRDAAGDVVEREVGGVLGLDDRGGVLEEARAVADGGRSVHRYQLYGATFPER